jgi:hypothetical protein
MDAERAYGTQGPKYAAHGGADRLQPRDVAAERLADAAGLFGIALHVADREGRAGQREADVKKRAAAIGVTRPPSKTPGGADRP